MASPDGALGGIVFGALPRLGSMYADVTFRWSAGGLGFYVSGVTGHHHSTSPTFTSSRSGNTAHKSLRALLRALLPLAQACSGLMGDYNFVSPAEGRMDTRTSEVHYSHSLVTENFLGLTDFHKILADGFSRRQFHDRELHQFHRLDSAPTLPSKDSWATVAMTCTPSRSPRSA